MKGVEELRFICDNMNLGLSTAIWIGRYLARGLNYYTGLFEVAIKEAMGSIGGGGRYDDLIFGLKT
jgi:histidyl-tRNA synthetase